jgi:ATP-binding cassette subfamily B multidrug efflux pump
MSPARRLWAYLERYRGRYAIGILCLIAATGISLCIPWTIKNAIDALGHAGGASLPRYVVIILLLAAANGAARMGSRFAMLGAGQWVERDVRDDLFAHLLTMPPAFYHAHRVGDLMSRASSDISAVRQLAGFGTVMMSGTALAFVGTLTAMWLIDPWLTVYALAPFPFLVLVAKRFIHQVEMRSTEVQEQLGVLSAKIQENLGGMPVVRAYTVEAREIADFGRLNDEYLRRSLRLARVQALSVPLMGLVSGIGGLIVLWLGGKAVVDQRITLGAFVAFNAYLAHLAWPTIALGWTLSSIKRGLASMRRIAEILDTRAPADEVRGEAAAAPLLPAGPIEFRDLTFSYGDRGPALEGVSFRVPQGGLVAVVGPTGSGKSTLGLLLCRLFEPPRGTVFVGGVDVGRVSRHRLRRSVGYVPQEAFLFSRSLRDNVLFAGAAGPEHLRGAAAAAGLGEEVEAFPDGWDTVVGERGLTLSGGQRQRAALARALAGAPPYLVLDDVLASVDAAKEWEILRSLRAAVTGRTTLLITHRLRAAQEADAIVVLDEGRVVETGTHAELVSAGGAYARLWRVQQLEDELANA